MINAKYRVRDVAKDFDIKSNYVTELLEKHFEGQKKSMTALESDELDMLFDTITSEHQAESFDDYFALKSGKEQAQPEKAEPKEEPKPEEKKERKLVAGSAAGAAKAASIRPEINLVGKRVDEAIAELDKYLDDAYLAHLPQVTVIHGRGTGALRTAVQNHCRNLRYVKEYHAGAYGEGDHGVTIVVFQ